MRAARGGLGGLVLVATLAGPVSAQKLRAAVMGDPTMGRPAPEVVLPYWSNGTPGPADQPFRLSAELGRVVVLAFGNRVGQPGWAAVAARADSMGSPRVSLVAVAWAHPAELASVTGSNHLKILADSQHVAHRAYGVGFADRWAFFVVADDGRILWRARQVDVASPSWWGELVRRARGGVPEAPR